MLSGVGSSLRIAAQAAALSAGGCMFSLGVKVTVSALDRKCEKKVSQFLDKNQWGMALYIMHPDDSIPLLYGIGTMISGIALISLLRNETSALAAISQRAAVAFTGELALMGCRRLFSVIDHSFFKNRVRQVFTKCPSGFDLYFMTPSTIHGAKGNNDVPNLRNTFPRAIGEIIAGIALTALLTRGQEVLATTAIFGASRFAGHFFTLGVFRAAANHPDKKLNVKEKIRAIAEIGTGVALAALFGLKA